MVPFCWAFLSTAFLVASTSAASLSYTKGEALRPERGSLDQPNTLRTKRSGRGYARGQTQSQYLNFGKPEQDGKAEAEANENGSRSTVSGSHGMGQAQSQFSFGDCSDCTPTQIYEYPSGPPDPLTYPGGTSGTDSSNFVRPGPITGTQGRATGEVGGARANQLDVAYRPGQEQSGSGLPPRPDQLVVTSGGQLLSEGGPTAQFGPPRIPGEQATAQLGPPRMSGGQPPAQLGPPRMSGGQPPAQLGPPKMSGGQPATQLGPPRIPENQSTGIQQGTYIPGPLASANQPQVGGRDIRFDETGGTTGSQNILSGPQRTQFIAPGTPQIHPNGHVSGGQEPTQFGGSRETRPGGQHFIGGQQGAYPPGQSILSPPQSTMPQQFGLASGSRPLDSSSVGLGAATSGTILSGPAQQPQGSRGINGHRQTLPQGTPGGRPRDSLSSREHQLSGGDGVLIGPPSGGQGTIRTQPSSGIYVPGATPGIQTGGVYARPEFPQSGSGIKQGYIGREGNQQGTAFGPSYGSRDQQSGVPFGTQHPVGGSINRPYAGGIQGTYIPGTQEKEIYPPGVVVPQTRPVTPPDVTQQTVYQPGSKPIQGNLYNHGIAVQHDRFLPRPGGPNAFASVPQDSFSQKTVPEPDIFYGSAQETAPGLSSRPVTQQSYPPGIKQDLSGTVTQQREPVHFQQGTSYIPGPAQSGPGIGLGTNIQPEIGGIQLGRVYTGSGVQPGVQVYGTPNGPSGQPQLFAYGPDTVVHGDIYSPATNAQGRGIPQQTPQQRVYGPGTIFQQGTYAPNYGTQHGIHPGTGSQPNSHGSDIGRQPIVYTSGADTQQRAYGGGTDTQQAVFGGGQTYGQGPAHVDFGTGRNLQQGVYSPDTGPRATGQPPGTYYPNSESPGGKIYGAGNVYGAGRNRVGIPPSVGQSGTYGPPAGSGAQDGRQYVPSGIAQQGSPYSTGSAGMPGGGNLISGTGGSQTVPFYTPQSGIQVPSSGGSQPGSVYGSGTGIYGQSFQPGTMLPEQPRSIVQIPISGPGLQPEPVRGPDISRTSATYPGTAQIGYPGSLGGGAGVTTGVSVPPGNLLGTVGADGTGGADDAFSQAESSINDGQASASAQGKKNGGAAKTQVSGTYSSTGTFSASAMTSDSDRSANAQVSGSSEGAMSQSQGHGGAAQSQAQVQVNAKNGGTKASSQSGGIIHQSQSEVQANDKGGLADAQSSGPGQTSSQAQIGFRPRQDGNAIAPSAGGGQASAQSGSHSGQSQSQIQGQSKFGVSYHGAAQSASGTKEQVANYREQNRDLFHSISQFGSSDAVTDRVETVYSGPSLTSESELPLPDLQLKTSKSSKETSNKLDDDEGPLVDEDEEEDPYDEYDDEEDYYNDKTVKMDENSKASTHSASPPVASTSKDESYATYRTHTQSSPTQMQQIAVADPNEKYSFVQKQNEHVQRYPSHATTTTTEVVPSGFRGTVNIEKKFHTKALETSKGEDDSKETTEKGKHSNKVRTPDSYVTVTKSVTGSMDNSKNPPQENKNFQSTYYTKSSTCGYFTFSCNIVYGANGRSKICRPKAPTNGKC